MKDPGCMSSPMLFLMRMQMNCLLSFILEEEHLEGARKEPSSVDGIGTCQTFTSGDIYVRFSFFLSKCSIKKGNKYI